jgi:hypothetical protein
MMINPCFHRLQVIEVTEKALQKEDLTITGEDRREIMIVQTLQGLLLIVEILIITTVVIITITEILSPEYPIQSTEASMTIEEKIDITVQRDTTIITIADIIIEEVHQTIRIKGAVEGITTAVGNITIIIKAVDTITTDRTVDQVVVHIIMAMMIKEESHLGRCP